MGLYFGSSEKVKIKEKNGTCRLYIHAPSNHTANIMLLSFDNYILKDSNGLYLTVKEGK